METRRINIERSVSDDTREYIAGILKKSTVNLRGYIPDEILSVMNVLDFSSSSIPTSGLGTDILLSDKQINNLLDLTYLDLLVQYNDIFKLQDYMRRLDNIFDSVISSNVSKSSAMVHQAIRFKKLADSHLEYSDIVHEDLSSAVNLATEGQKLQVNHGAGMITLPGIEENYMREETSNVKLELYSTGVTIIDESDPSSVYTSSKSEPYFITVSTQDEPVNSSTTLKTTAEVDGMIVDLVISFAAALPVTRICLTPFSTAPIEIYGIYYTNVPGVDWSSGEMKTATGRIEETNNLEIEVNFDRIFAREIHVLIVQKHYTVSDINTEIDNTLTAEDYISQVCLSADSAYPEYFIEPANLETEIQEICSSISKIPDRQTYNIIPGSKIYTLGISSIYVGNISYLQTGKYLSDIRTINGNLSEVSYVSEINRSTNGASNIVEGVSIFSVVTAGENVYLGMLDTDTRVLDGNIIEQNMVLSGSSYIESPEYPGILSTHFLPTSDISGFTMYHNGNATHNIPDGSVVTRNNRSCSIMLSKSFMDTEGIYPGTAVTMKYTPAEYDNFSLPYKVNCANVIDVIGSPTFVNKDAAKITARYLYVLSGDTCIYSPAIGSAPAEYSMVTISGEVFARLTSDKGLTLDGINKIERSGVYYVSSAVINGPSNVLYYGIINEPSVIYDISSGEATATFRTEFQYVKGSLCVTENDERIPSVVEYNTTDTGDTRREFTLPISYESKSLAVSYIPVDADSASEYIGSNIAAHNKSEQFTSSSESRITLSYYPYIDPHIVSSDEFDMVDGVFYMKRMYSVVYEPVIIYINGIKATNITPYRTSTSSVPTFRKTYRVDDYQYYTENGNTFVFNKDIKGSIMIYYYVFSNKFREQIEMFRSNYKNDYTTPEVTGYTVLTNITR